MPNVPFFDRVRSLEHNVFIFQWSYFIFLFMILRFKILFYMCSTITNSEVNHYKISMTIFIEKHLIYLHKRVSSLYFVIFCYCFVMFLFFLVALVKCTYTAWGLPFNEKILTFLIKITSVICKYKKNTVAFSGFIFLSHVLSVNYVTLLCTEIWFTFNRNFLQFDENKPVKYYHTQAVIRWTHYPFSFLRLILKKKMCYNCLLGIIFLFNSWFI